MTEPALTPGPSPATGEGRICSIAAIADAHLKPTHRCLQLEKDQEKVFRNRPNIRTSTKTSTVWWEKTPNPYWSGGKRRFSGHIRGVVKEKSLPARTLIYADRRQSLSSSTSVSSVPSCPSSVHFQRQNVPSNRRNCERLSMSRTGHEIRESERSTLFRLGVSLAA